MRTNPVNTKNRDEHTFLNRPPSQVYGVRRNWRWSHDNGLYVQVGGLVHCKTMRATSHEMQTLSNTQSEGSTGLQPMAHLNKRSQLWEVSTRKKTSERCLAWRCSYLCLKELRQFCNVASTTHQIKQFRVDVIAFRNLQHEPWHQHCGQFYRLMVGINDCFHWRNTKIIKHVNNPWEPTPLPLEQSQHDVYGNTLLRNSGNDSSAK
jgi:hypothetical protein